MENNFTEYAAFNVVKSTEVLKNRMEVKTCWISINVFITSFQIKPNNSEINRGVASGLNGGKVPPPKWKKLL